MNVFALFDFVNIFLAVFLCALVYLRDPSGKLSRYFLIITFVSIYCALCEFFRLTAPDIANAIFWHKASFLWPFLPFIFYQFILIQTESKLYSNEILNSLFFLPGVFIATAHLFTNLLYTDMVHHLYGWEYIDAANIYTVFIAIYFSLCGVFSMIIAFYYFITQHNKSKSKQSIYTITGISIPVVAGLITKGILPQFGVNTPPMMALFYLIGSVFLAVSILKYKSFLVNPFDVIKKMFDASPDYLVVYDNNGKIVLASKSFLRYTSYSEDEIIGQKLDVFFKTENRTVVEQLANELGKEIELSLKTKSNNYADVSVTTSVISNYIKNENFYLILGRDLSERKHFENQLIQFKQGLEEKVKIRTAELAKSNLDLHLEIKERKNVENALRESEKRYRDLFENSPIGIYRTTPDGKILLANPVIIKMLGYKDFAELKERNLEKEGYSEHSYSQAEFKKNIEINGSITGLESKWVKKDGSEIFVRENAKCVYGINRKPVYYEGTVEDITEKVKAIEALKESEEKFRSLSEQSPNMIFIFQNERIIYVNKKFSEVLGYTEEFFTSAAFDWKNLLSTESLNKVNIVQEQIFNGEELSLNEYTFVKKDGQNIEVLVSTSNINYMGSNAVLGILTDITYRIEAENALKESEERFRNLIENINEIFYISDSKGRTIYVSPNIYNFTGYPVNEWIGEKALKFVYKGDLKRVMHFYIENNNKDTIDASIEFRSLKKDGSIFWVEQMTRFVRDSNGKIFEYRNVTRDISVRKSAQEKIQLLAQAVKSTNDGISITDLDNNLIFVNDAFLKIHGYTENELIGKDINIVRSQNNPEHLLEEIRDATVKGEWQGELINRKKNGTEFPISLSTSSVVDDKGTPYGLVGITRNISERKKFEKALRESEKRYRNLFNNSPLGIYRTTPDGKIILANPAIMKMLGYDDLRELIRRDLEQEGYDENSLKRSDFKFAIEKYGEVKGIEVKWLKKDGSTVILRESAKCVRDENNNVLYYDGTVEDITEQVNAIKALKESEEKFRTLSEKSPNVIFIVNRGRIIYMNERCTEVIGYNKEYFTSPSFEWKNVLTAESYTNARAKYGENITKYNPSPGEFTLINNEGKEVEVLVSTTPINYFGETVSMAILTDITERRNTEKQLQKYRNHLENLVAERTQKLDNVNKLLKEEIEKLKIAEENIQNQLSFMSILLDTIPNPIFIRDAQKLFTGCNKAFEEFHGLKRENVTGKTIFETLPFEVARIEDKSDEELLKSGEAQSYESLAYDHKGIVHDVLVYKGTFSKADGALGGVVGVMLDITDFKQLQKEILRSLNKEKELNELKSRFISVASHEFRTPLTTILAAADLLELYGKDWPGEKYYEYLRNIQNAVIYMNELINDVLTVNKSESDNIKFNPAETDLYDLLNGIFENIKLSAPENIKLIFEYQLKENIFELDSKLVTQIITNLLSNAIKYSPNGGIVLFRVTKENGSLLLTISDEGIGIPKEDQKLLFEPFHRGQNVGAISGTGLGLSIVNKSTQIHHGTLSINSDLNKGTEVIISLPCD
jgi:PAS domain S-box-containing protein